MAQPVDLMGLGLPVYVAGALGTTVTSVTAAGGSAGSATQMPGQGRVMVINASNSGSGVLLPAVTGDVNKSLLADRTFISNLLGAAVVIFANNTAQGSGVTFIIDGGSISGLLGFSIAAGKSIEMVPISVSTWVGLRSA